MAAAAERAARTAAGRLSAARKPRCSPPQDRTTILSLDTCADQHEGRAEEAEVQVQGEGAQPSGAPPALEDGPAAGGSAQGGLPTSLAVRGGAWSVAAQHSPACDVMRLDLLRGARSGTGAGGAGPCGAPAGELWACVVDTDAQPDGAVVAVARGDTHGRVVSRPPTSASAAAAHAGRCGCGEGGVRGSDCQYDTYRVIRYIVLYDRIGNHWCEETAARG